VRISPHHLQSHCAPSQPTKKDRAVDINAGAKITATCDLGQAMSEDGMIEECREREAKVVQPRPIQVDRRGVLRFALGCSTTPFAWRKLSSRGYSVDEQVDPTPRVARHRGLEFSLPPKINTLFHTSTYPTSSPTPILPPTSPSKKNTNAKRRIAPPTSTQSLFLPPPPNLYHTPTHPVSRVVGIQLDGMMLGSCVVHPPLSRNEIC